MKPRTITLPMMGSGSATIVVQDETDEAFVFDSRTRALLAFGEASLALYRRWEKEHGPDHPALMSFVDFEVRPEFASLLSEDNDA